MSHERGLQTAEMRGAYSFADGFQYIRDINRELEEDGDTLPNIAENLEIARFCSAFKDDMLAICTDTTLVRGDVSSVGFYKTSHGILYGNFVGITHIDGSIFGDAESEFVNRIGRSNVLCLTVEEGSVPIESPLGNFEIPRNFYVPISNVAAVSNVQEMEVLFRSQA